MAYTLKDKIFSFFGVNAKVKDTFKDGAGKGITERYQECIGEGYDDELKDLVDNLIDNTLVPQTMLSKLIPHMESMMGNPVVVSDAVATRRKVIQFAQKIYDYKSTIVSYQILFRLLGLDYGGVSIVIHTPASGFDSPDTLDAPSRTFDGAKCCVEYSVFLTGSPPLTPELEAAIFRIIEFLEPVNASLRTAYYNGADLLYFNIFDETFDSTFE
jgi:hypothetical protein